MYAQVEPGIAEADAEQAGQAGQIARRARRLAAELRDREAEGAAFTAEEADTLGGEAQERAEAIAGQVSQAAQKLGIELES